MVGSRKRSAWRRSKLSGFRQADKKSRHWKYEFQQRGAAHFHLLAFGLHGEALDTLRAWVTAKWYATAHNGDKHHGSAACEVDPVKHHGGLIQYMASYIAKNDQTRPGDFTGRYWGVFARKRLPIGELHTLELTPQQWVRVRRLARKKMSIDIERRRWSLFFKDINPRQPAPGPEYGLVVQHPAALGNRLWWEQLKSAHHSGARRFHALQWQHGEWREHEDELVWLLLHLQVSPLLVSQSASASHPHAPNPDTPTTSDSSATPRASSMQSDEGSKAG